MDITQFLDILNGSGVIGLLALIIVGGWRRWYIWSGEHQEVVKDRDFWRELALKSMNATERSLDLKTRFPQ